MKEIVLGGGCFWCIEAIFQQLKGVEEVQPGYAGGEQPNPSYREVCSGSTGHAEVAKIRFDESVISEETLLDIFWHAHDPTTPNRQGNDVGPQYRSIALYQDPEQKATIEKVLRQIQKDNVWPRPIVTEIKALETFYPAEDYHKDYFKNNPSQPYCSIVIGPKVQKVKEKYSVWIE